jgi:hypothetical protein
MCVGSSRPPYADAYPAEIFLVCHLQFFFIAQGDEDTTNTNGSNTGTVAPAGSSWPTVSTNNGPIIACKIRILNINQWHVKQYTTHY